MDLNLTNTLFSVSTGCCMAAGHLQAANLSPAFCYRGAVGPIGACQARMRAAALLQPCLSCQCLRRRHKHAQPCHLHPAGRQQLGAALRGLHCGCVPGPKAPCSMACFRSSLQLPPITADGSGVGQLLTPPMFLTLLPGFLADFRVRSSGHRLHMLPQSGSSRVHTAGRRQQHTDCYARPRQFAGHLRPVQHGAVARVRSKQPGQQAVLQQCAAH